MSYSDIPNVKAAFASLRSIGVIPVVTLDDPDLAVPLAHALVAGGLPAAEVTFRTPAAAEVIRRMSQGVPELMVGAGTVLDERTTEEAVGAGARFVVSPGLAPDSIRWCVAHEVPVIPGLATPTEVQQALALGLDHVKLFPATVLGGRAMLHALGGPYPQVRFMCTGGVRPDNMVDLLTAPNVFAVGGTWLTPASALEAGDMSQVERLCRDAVRRLHGFRLTHVGINAHGSDRAVDIATQLGTIFGLPVRELPGAVFADDMVEVVRDAAPGERGHIAIACNDVPRAMDYLRARGYEFTDEGLARDERGIVAVYLKDQIAGFGVHLRRA